MATVLITLDKRRKLNDSTFPVIAKIGVSRLKQIVIPLRFYCREEDWSFTRSRVNESAPFSEEINPKLAEYSYRLESELRDLEFGGMLEVLAAGEIKERLKKCLSRYQSTSFLQDHFRTVIDRHRNIGTRKIYELTLRKIDQFSEGRRILIPGVTLGWLSNFEEFLIDQKHKTNGVNLHLRNLRTVINSAIKNGIVRNYEYPFAGFKMKTEPTMKRDLLVEDIRVIRDYEDPQWRKYLDLWLLSFYLGGINFGDLCLLQKSNLQNGRIVYQRQKTKGDYISILVLQEAMDIINRYQGKEHLLDVLDDYDSKDYKTFLRRMNRALKTFGPCTVGRKGKKTRTPLYPFLSTYYTRHSFATIASEDCDIPEDIVGRILGHAQKSVTSIYIHRKNRRMDEALRKVVQYVNEDKI